MTFKKSRFIYLIGMLLLLSSCTRSISLEDLNIVYGVAFDLQTEHNFKATYHIPFYQEQEIENLVVSVTGNSSKETQGLAELQLSGKIGDDKVKLIMIDKKLASKGTNAVLKPFLKDRRVPAMIKVAVAESSAESFLQSKNKHLDPSTTIVKMITQNEHENALPVTDLQHFFFNWRNAGEDPYLPLMTMKEENPLISGLALFKDDKYVKSLKRYKDILLFAMISRSVSNAKYEYKWEDQSLTARIKENQVRFKWDPGLNIPRMDLEMRVKAIIAEPPDSFNIPTHSELQSMESSLEKNIEEGLEVLLHEFQKLEIDPVGIGSIARSKQRDWQAEIWTNIYPIVDFSINVKVDFLQDEV